MNPAPRPIRCPHGTELTIESARRAGLCGVYVDGCRCSSGIPPLFWCGEDEMSKPNGVRIYKGEYLRDWSEALTANERMGERLCSFRGLISKRPCALPSGHDEPHDMWRQTRRETMDRLHTEALILNAGDDLYDAAERLNRIHDGLGRLAEKYGQTLDICNWCGGLALLESGACSACASDAAEHAEYLGEVPWTDRVDD
jgi:hypothetical protein